MGGYPSVLVGSVSVCHFKLMNRLTHSPGCVKAPTIWAIHGGEKEVNKIMQIHDGEKEVNKIMQIPFSDTTVARRCAVISADIKEQLIQKILKASSFGIQLDETTDITSEAQVMVFCRFPDIETNRIVEHYLFCQPVGVRATAETIFQN